MSTAPLEPNPGDEAAPHGYVRFTKGGEDALDAVAGRLAAEAGDTPESIAKVLDRILSRDVADLAAEITAAETPDEAARRRLDRHQERGQEAPSRPSVQPPGQSR